MGGYISYLLLVYTIVILNVNEAFSYGTIKSTFLSRPLRVRTKFTHVCRGMFFLQMGCEVKIRIVGRKNGSEPWIEDGYKMYETRLRPSTVDLMTIWHKNNDELVKNVLSEAEKGHTIILLDPLGKKMKSEVFSESMYKWLENGGSRLTFVIGGADGLPDDLRFDLNGPMKQSTYSVTRFQMMSLSDLTFTHQFARTLLAEQIYRATEIRKGSGYHK